jgi:hypothetical protein
VIFEVWMGGKNRARTLKACAAVSVRRRRIGRNVNKLLQISSPFQTFFCHFSSVLDNFNSYRRLANVQTKRLIHILSKLVQVEVSFFWAMIVVGSLLLGRKGHTATCL